MGCCGRKLYCKNIIVQNLWIFGDSFANLVADSNERVWQRQLIRRLCQHYDRELMLHVLGLPGSSQDWAAEQFVLAEKDIQPDDHVIFVATSPSRYWYFKDKPSLSNWNIVDFDEVCNREQAQAVELYIKHIQRLELDILQCASRMALIAYETRRHLRNPVMVLPVSLMTAGPADHYKDDLIWAQGCLSEVQWNEYHDPIEASRRSQKNIPGYFEGVDCRYNHLCLRNHDILAEKLFHTMIHGEPLDLTQGFHQHIVRVDWYEDTEFVESELNQASVPFYHEMNQKAVKENYLPWKKRTGISNIIG